MNLFTVNLLLWLDYRIFEVRRSISLHSAYPPGLALSLFFNTELATKSCMLFQTLLSAALRQILSLLFELTYGNGDKRGFQWLSNLLLMTQRVNGCGRIWKKPGSSVSNCVLGTSWEVDAEKPSAPDTKPSGSRNTESMWGEPQKDALKDWKKCLGSNPANPCLSEGCIED